jgi:hypothetical protein
MIKKIQNNYLKDLFFNKWINSLICILCLVYIFIYIGNYNIRSIILIIYMIINIIIYNHFRWMMIDYVIIRTFVLSCLLIGFFFCMTLFMQYNFADIRFKLIHNETEYSDKIFLLVIWIYLFLMWFKSYIQLEILEKEEKGKSNIYYKVIYNFISLVGVILIFLGLNVIEMIMMIIELENGYGLEKSNMMIKCYWVVSMDTFHILYNQIADWYDNIKVNEYISPIYNESLKTWFNDISIYNELIKKFYNDLKSHDIENIINNLFELAKNKSIDNLKNEYEGFYERKLYIDETKIGKFKQYILDIWYTYIYRK